MSNTPYNSSTMRSAIDAIMPDVIAIRRQLHRQPELSGHEVKTAAMVAEKCRSLGLDVREGIGGHGLVATLEQDPRLPWLAFRADMDGLPIQENSPDQGYQSQREGVSHSCGHDAHTAILLGTIGCIVPLRQSLQFNIAFIFQPAEETCQGASAMLADKLFDRFTPERIYALHVYPYLPAGSIGFRAGAMCAAADMFDVELTGHGGHAARPHECIDVILIAAHIIQALHQIVGRRVNPLHPAVLTIGQIHGGHAGNVIPESVRFSGTIRSLNSAIHEEMRGSMDRIIRQTADTWGATARFTLKQATSVLINDDQVLRHAEQLLVEQCPDIERVHIDEASMGGEDFAEFLQTVPGCLFRLGTGSSPATRYPLHHPCFDIDERSMASGIALFTMLALQDKG